MASVATGYALAKLTGQTYGLREAGLDFVLGAATAGASLAGKAKSAAKVVDRVIGHYPEYLQVADAVGAKAFDVPGVAYKLAGSYLNRRFLDKGIRDGAEFVLATAKDDIRRGSILEREVKYLFDNGYQWSRNNMSLIPK